MQIAAVLLYLEQATLFKGDNENPPLIYFI